MGAAVDACPGTVEFVHDAMIFDTCRQTTHVENQGILCKQYCWLHVNRGWLNECQVHTWHRLGGRWQGYG
jgi:hypothetical protein